MRFSAIADGLNAHYSAAGPRPMPPVTLTQLNDRFRAACRRSPGKLRRRPPSSVTKDSTRPGTITQLCDLIHLKDGIDCRLTSIIGRADHAEISAHAHAPLSEG